MCPACIAGAAWLIGSTVTGGGAGILGLRRLRRKTCSKAYGAANGNDERRKGDGECDKQTASAQSGRSS